MKTYFYQLLYKYLSVYIQPNNSLLEIHPQNAKVLEQFRDNRTAVLLDGDNTNAFSPAENLKTFEDIAS